MNKAIQYLQSPETIRSHCHQIRDLGLNQKLNHFTLHEKYVKETVHYVLDEINRNYPSHNIPYHSRFRHFEVGGINRIKELETKIASVPPFQKAKAFFELTFISVIVDAGAGDNWTYTEPDTEHVYTRSEGLAVASYHMFCNGFFSTEKNNPFQVDAQALVEIKEEEILKAFQVTKENPLAGIKGRLQLLHRLGEEIRNQPHLFGKSHPRLGNLCDVLTKNPSISAHRLLGTLLDAFSNIWPSGYRFKGVNIGDIGEHSLIRGAHGTDGLIPFHKLSQWLSYSLFEPLELAGITITEMNQLTGLPEYRNGGLLLDMNVIQPKVPEKLKRQWHPQDEFIVEFRALTVALLDVIGEEIRKKLNKTEEAFPLVKVLQGGTWSAGRRRAKELRTSGKPPISIHSDGTVF